MLFLFKSTSKNKKRKHSEHFCRSKGPGGSERASRTYCTNSVKPRWPNKSSNQMLQKQDFSAAYFMKGNFLHKISTPCFCKSKGPIGQAEGHFETSRNRRISCVSSRSPHSWIPPATVPLILSQIAPPPLFSGLQMTALDHFCVERDTTLFLLVAPLVTFPTQKGKFQKKHFKIYFLAS